MIRLFLLLLACIAGSWYVADAIKEKGPGYVYIYFDQYSLETSFWFALLLLVGLVVVIYAITRLVASFLYHLVKAGYLPRYFLMGRAKKLQHQGRLAFLGENWALASKKLGKAARYSDTSFLDYVMAARASLAAGNAETARQLADRARAADDVDPVVLALLQMDVAAVQAGALQQQYLLEKMLQEHGDTPGLLGRAVDVYSRNGQWEKLWPLLPAIRKRKVLDKARLQALQEKVAAGLQASGSPLAPQPGLKQLWQKGSQALAQKFQ